MGLVIIGGEVVVQAIAPLALLLGFLTHAAKFEQSNNIIAPHTTSNLHCHLQLPLVLLFGQDLSNQLVGGCVPLEGVGPAGGLEGGIQHSFPQQPLCVEKMSGVVFWPLPQQEVQHFFCEVSQVLPVPLLLDLEVAADVVQLGVDVDALELCTLLRQVGIVPGKVLGDVDEVLVDLGGLEVLLLVVQFAALLAALLVVLALDLDLVRVAVINAVQRDLVVEAGAHSVVPLQFFFRIFDDAAVLEQLSPVAGNVHELVAYVEPCSLLDSHGHDLTMEGFWLVAGQLSNCHFLDVLAVVVVLEAGVVGIKCVLLEVADHFIHSFLQDVLGSPPADESRLDAQQEPQVLVHLQLQRLCPLRPALLLLAFATHFRVNYYTQPSSRHKPHSSDIVCCLLDCIFWSCW